MPKKRIHRGGIINSTDQGPANTQGPANQVMVQGGPKQLPAKVPPNPTLDTSSQNNPTNLEGSSMFSSFTSMFDMSAMDTKQILTYVGLFIVGIVLTYALYSVLSTNNNASKNDDKKEEEEGNNKEEELVTRMVESVVSAAVSAGANTQGEYGIAIGFEAGAASLQLDGLARIFSL